jgi:thiamine-monophosphate kinase
MDERSALALIAADLPAAGDDCAVVDDLVVTTDMLHERTDFPDGTTRYTAGWRAVGASLSDVAAMGAEATAALAVYGSPTFDPDELRAFLSGARDVCERVGGEYVGGDLDGHAEFTVATTAIGRTDSPVLRSGASPGDVLCVTGSLGRSAGAIRLFEAGEHDRANDRFRFTPRVRAGVALHPYATAMMDSSDGLARSLHQLSEASDCGFSVERERVPVDPVLDSVASEDAFSLATTFGEDFELVFTLSGEDLPAAREASPAPVSRIGTVTEDGVELGGRPLADEGYTHGT